MKLKLTEKMTHEERLDAILKWEAANEAEWKELKEKHIQNILQIHKEHQDAIQRLNDTAKEIREIIADIKGLDKQIQANKGEI